MNSCLIEAKKYFDMNSHEVFDEKKISIFNLKCALILLFNVDMKKVCLIASLLYIDHSYISLSERNFTISI
jgi:hypothetical protein